MLINRKAWRASIFILALPLMQKVKGQTITEVNKPIKTYPFSDANPVPSMAVNNNIGRFYPYFMFDAYSKDDTMQTWKVVTLKNEFITVTVLPEVGGKVYGAIENATGKEFIYLNDVMKFRAIGSRGPWTSGGIEHNFGLDIGHAPWAAAPVDYITRKKADGTVECVVGGLDLASRTQWRVTIALPKNSAFFETKALWYNPTPYHHSYLSWENAAYKATDDLEFFFPGNYHIGHDGSARPWPIDENGRDISKYRNNNFGSSKSYHVMGSTRNWFGGLWQNDDFGFGHWAPYTDAPGKKLWIWSLAREGAIWEDLLTDSDGQYIEAQSGVKFNQADLVSGYHSPFKQLYLRPGYTETKYEAWFPVKNIKGISDAMPAASLHVVRTNDNINVSLSPNIFLKDTLYVTGDGKTLYKTVIDLKPLQVYKINFKVPSHIKNTVVKTVKSKLEYKSSPEFISRPVTSPDNYNGNDAARLFILGEDKNSMRLHEEALRIYKQCLEKEPSHTGALARIAELLYRKTDDDSAAHYAKRALAINAYDAPANYIYGIIERRRGNVNDAEEAFSVALRSLEFRSESYRQLAELAMLKKDFIQAVDLSKNALNFNSKNIAAHQVLCAALRKTGKLQEADRACHQLLETDALNHFARFELYRINGNAENLKQFTSPIKNEFPHESFIELATTYYAMGLNDEAVKVLHLSPAHPMVYYWIAFLQKDRQLVQKAESLDARYIFPFREESIPVLQYAISESKSWKPKYYLSLIYWHKGANAKASKLLRECEDRADFAPFYITRAVLGSNASSIEHDLKKAIEMEPGEWRTYQYLADHYSENARFRESAGTWKEAARRYPDHAIVQVGYAGALLRNKNYHECLSVLKKVYVLPQEHANQGHSIFENANTAVAIEKIKSAEWDSAAIYLNEAKKWPEHLGSGTPYDPDNRLQDILLAYCAKQKGNTAEADKIKKQIRDFTVRTWPETSKIPGNYIGIRELRAAGEKTKAEEMIREWKNNTDSLAKWGLPGGQPNAIRDYIFTALTDQTAARQLEEKMVLSPHNISDRLFIEAVRIVYE